MKMSKILALLVETLPGRKGSNEGCSVAFVRTGCQSGSSWVELSDFFFPKRAVRNIPAS
jgi:hypothetical protein